MLAQAAASLLLFGAAFDDVEAGRVLAFRTVAAAETAAAEFDIARVNAMDRAEFVKTFGGLFEHSPWVAEGAFAGRPFGNAKALHEAMMQVVRNAPVADKVRLFNAHPELAGKDARQKTMTASSVSEQGSAGLDRMTPEDFDRFDRLNAEYREKFGFPFIIAVRGRTKDEIVAEFERRLRNSREVEIEAQIGQIEAITHMRLERILGPFP